MTMMRGLLQPDILRAENFTREQMKQTKAISFDCTKPGIQVEIQINTFAAQGVPLCRDWNNWKFRKAGGGEHPIWIVPWHHSRNGRQ